eukprot:3922571-Alexandrium_andersonii.AAC.1
MTHPPGARASADADGGAAIVVHAEAGQKAEVQGNASYAHAFRGTFRDACQLGFPRAQCDRLLRGEPALT